MNKPPGIFDKGVVFDNLDIEGMVMQGLKATDKLNEFMNEFHDLLKKYLINDIILVNSDDDAMGYNQLMKFVDLDNGKFLVMRFSGTGETLCPCCKEKEGH